MRRAAPPASAVYHQRRDGAGRAAGGGDPDEPLVAALWVGPVQATGLARHADRAEQRPAPGMEAAPRGPALGGLDQHVAQRARGAQVETDARSERLGE